MQRSNHTFVGLDVGSSKVACVVGTLENEALEPSIIGLGRAANHGMRKGAVTDLDDVVSAISGAIDEAERLSGRTIERVTVGVGGTHIKSLNSKGVIAVGGMHHSITPDDVTRVEDAATVIQMPPNREILQVFSQAFRLDGQDNIKDPVGMSGVRLEVDAHVVTAATPALKNLQRCVYQTGLVINRQIMVSLAAARSVLDKRQRENGTALVDIGAATTSLAIFEEGEVLHTSVLPLGSGHITNDIAIGLRTDLDSAEEVKVRHVNVEEKSRHQRGASIKGRNGEIIHIDLTEVNHIASARLEELFELVNHELDRVKKAGKLPGGAVLSGGGAKLKGIEQVARDTLRLPVMVGEPTGFAGITDTASDPTYAVAVGLMFEDMLQAHRPAAVQITKGVQDAWSRLRGIANKLRP